MARRWIVPAVFLATALFVVLFLAGSRFSHARPAAAAAPSHYMALPDGDVAENLDGMDAYWNDRLTYPTGDYNPQWLRHAMQQAARIPARVPAGLHRSPAGSFAGGSARALEAQGLGKEARSPDALTSFIPLGPAPERMTGCGNCFDYTKTEGRINAFAVDPTTTTNGSIVAYAASVGGGVWKTTNCCSASTTWSNTTDDVNINDISIDTLAIDPNDHNTIYAGTGDLNYGSFSMGSQGVLKSTDGGGHWTVLGADIFDLRLDEPPGTFPQYDAVGKVRVDPNNSQNVVAGTKKGLFFSYDGGANWTGPCLTNGFTTQRQDITGLELTDLGGGVTRILAAVGVRGFASTVQFDLGNNGANGLYRGTMQSSGCPSFDPISTNANGFTFGTQVTGSPYTTGANLNLDSGNSWVNATTGDQAGRIDIAVAPSDPNTIYAQVQSVAPNNNAGCGNTNGCQLGAFASTDGGSTWSFLAGSQGGALRNCIGTNTSGNPGDYPQNWYDQGIAVDPNNPDRAFFDTYDVWLVSRTGTAWTDMTCGYNGASAANHVVHVDQHALAFVNGSSSNLLVGSDGGTFGTTNADAGSPGPPVTRPTFFNMDNGINAIEFYSGDISGNFANSANPSAAGGAQDNAPSVVGFSGYPTGPAQWQLVTGGDGFYARIDPVGNGTNPRYFVGNNSGGLSRCTNTTCLTGGSGYSSARGPWTGDTQSFIFPFDLFHGGIAGGDDCAPAGTPGGCGHLIGGTTRVWETVAGGNATMNTASWYVTNNPSTQNMTKQSLGNRSFINQVKYSPKWSSDAIVGTNDGNVWIGFNLGTGVAGQANWVNVTDGNTVLPNRPVLGIALDPSSPSRDLATGYAAVGGFNENTPGTPGHVFQVTCTSNCASSTWADKSGDLPDIPVDSVIVNPNFPQQVYAGTDFGVYYTNDINAASPTWFRFANGMPNVMVWDMQIDRGATTLSVWTRSRGAYVWQLPSSPVTLDQTISFGALADKTYGDSDFSVSATASSGLPVSFSASGDCTVTSDGSTVHITHAGSCTITASQAGNLDWNAAPDVQQTFAIDQKTLTITASDQSKLYGTTLALGSTAFTTSGLVSGEGIDSVTLTSAGAAGSAGVGAYPIVPSDAVASAGTDLTNYDVHYVNGTLTVYLSGLVGVDSATLSGKSTTADSFDSLFGPYGGGNVGSSALVLSNGPVGLSAGKVMGSIRSSQGSVSITGHGAVSGDVTAGTTITSDGTIGGSRTPFSPATAISAPAVAACSPYSSGAGITGGSYNPATGDLTVSGGRIATLANGSYCFHNLTLSGGSVLTVSGPVTMALTGILSGGGGSFLNTTNVPANLQIASSYAGFGGVVISGGTGAYLSVYAPRTDVVVSGSSPVYGALLGRTLTASGGAGLHYDTELTTIWASFFGL